VDKDQLAQMHMREKFISPDSLNTASSSLTLRDEIRKEIKSILREEIGDLVESEIKNELKSSIKDLMNEVKEEVTQSLYILSNTNTQMITEFSIEAERRGMTPRDKNITVDKEHNMDTITTVDLISPFQ
jgi:polyribonucleotide nucleotidyltransferase